MGKNVNIAHHLSRWNDSYLRSVKFPPVVNSFLCLLCQFLLHLRTSSKEDVVDESVFQKSQEDKDKAAHQVHVYSFDVGDLGQSLSQMCVDSCHGQDSGDACEVNMKNLSQNPDNLDDKSSAGTDRTKRTPRIKSVTAQRRCLPNTQKELSVLKVLNLPLTISS